MWPLPAVYAAQVSQHVWLCGHRRPRVGAHTLCACKRGQPVPSAVPGAVPDGHGTGSANCTNALSKAGCVLHTPLCLQQALSLWAAFLCKWCYLCLQASAPIANQLFVLFVIVGRCSLDWQLIYYLCSQASAPIVDSLFADSIPTGKRAGLYTGLTVSYVLSSAVGPATAAVLFVLHGDVWSTECMSRVLPLRLLAPLSKRMSRVMLMGLALACIPASLLLMFDDTRVLGQEAEGLLKAKRLRSCSRSVTVLLMQRRHGVLLMQTWGIADAVQTWGAADAARC
eukprot:1157745-Pelagomonas_calceolata.AAC.7